MGRSPAQGAEQIGVEVGHRWDLVLEGRHANRDSTVSLTKRTTAITAEDEGTVRRAGRATVIADRNIRA
jgi:hypothetical protein